MNVGSSLLKIKNTVASHTREKVVVALGSLWNLFVHKVRALQYYMPVQGEGGVGAEGDGGGGHEARAVLVYL